MCNGAVTDFASEPGLIFFDRIGVWRVETRGWESGLVGVSIV